MLLVSLMWTGSPSPLHQRAVYRGAIGALGETPRALGVTVELMFIKFKGPENPAD